jgi:hypothetical protein
MIGPVLKFGSKPGVPWKPFGTLWKHFSSGSPYLSLIVGGRGAGGQFSRPMLFILNRLIISRFTNLYPVLSSLWKPDCDCFSEFLRVTTGTLWR